MLRNGHYTIDAWRLKEPVYGASGLICVDQSPAVFGESSKPERANFAGTVPRGSADIYSVRGHHTNLNHYRRNRMSKRIRVKTADQVKLYGISVELDMVDNQIKGIKLGDGARDLFVRMDSYSLSVEVSAEPQVKDVFTVSCLWMDNTVEKKCDTKQQAEIIAQEMRDNGATDVCIFEDQVSVADNSVFPNNTLDVLEW